MTDLRFSREKDRRPDCEVHPSDVGRDLLWVMARAHRREAAILCIADEVRL